MAIHHEDAGLRGATAPLRLAPAPVRQGGSGSVWTTTLPTRVQGSVEEHAVRGSAPWRRPVAAHRPAGRGDTRPTRRCRHRATAGLR